MKIKNLFYSAALLSLLAASTGQAQLQWDADATPPPTGGSGTWNAVLANWFDGVNDVQWIPNQNAVFGGTAGSVSVEGVQDASGLTFNTAGYTLGGAGTINLTGATPTISGAAGQVINTVLSGTSGVTITGSSKAFGGNNVNLDGVINADGTPSLVIVRANHNNAFGDSAAFADRLNIVNGGSGAILQLGDGIVLPKYITTSGGNVSVEVLGNSSFTGPVVNSAGLIYSFTGPATTHTLSGSAGLGATNQSVLTGGNGRLIVDAVAAGATGYGLFIRDSSTVQVNSAATLGSPNIFFSGPLFGGVGSTPALALNGATVSNNAFFSAPATVTARIENMAAGTSTFSGRLLANSVPSYEVTLRSTTTGTLNVSGNIEGDATVNIGNASFANAGTVALSRAAGTIYSGTTTVHSGTLLANNTSGSATGTGAVAVNGGVLGGTGFIAPTGTNGITVAGGAAIAPGASIGMLTLDMTGTTGEVTMANGSLFVFELGTPAATLGGAGANSDLLSITGSSPGDFNFAALGNTVNLVGGAEGFYKLFNTDLANATALGDTWDNLTYDPSTGAVSSGLNAANALFFVGTGTNAAGLADAGNVGDIYVQVVPEPSTFAMLAGGLGLLGIWHRRRSGSVR